MSKYLDAPDGVVVEMARSVAHRSLPTCEPHILAGKPTVTLVLFYQYVEPLWTEKEHKEALKFVNALAKEHNICGRGRCAREGLNCSCTGPPLGVRAFCMGLRKWNPLFEETDFKLTDGIQPGQGFKAFTLRKTEELVAYGLAGELAPSLKENSAQHVEADEYHRLMEQPDTVIIDVRNAYESAIGHFNPPPGGAELVDPKMRNSHEFPKWLNSDETKAKLAGKKVMMYCTGGIRCERATALLHQLEQNNEVKTQGVVMVRGGIERYMRTFPEGGYWKGKNYLFDRRFEQAAEQNLSDTIRGTPCQPPSYPAQMPEAKPAEKLNKEIESHCCVCEKPWDRYRGNNKCAGMLPMPIGRCAVPVLVCTSCQNRGDYSEKELFCPLCKEGYIPAKVSPVR